MRKCELLRALARPPQLPPLLSAAAAGCKLAPHGRRTHARSSVGCASDDGNVVLGYNARNHENGGDDGDSRCQTSPSSSALCPSPRSPRTPRLGCNLFRNLAWAFAEEAVQCGVIQSPCTARTQAIGRSVEVFLRVFLCPSTVAAAQSLSPSLPLFLSCHRSALLLLHTHQRRAVAPTVGRQFSRKVTDK